MKKLLIAAAVTLVSVGAFAQGKLSFDINSDNLIYFTTSTSGGLRMLAGDSATTYDSGYGAGAILLAGQSLQTGGTIAALGRPTTFTAGLMAGTSAGSLSLITSTTLGDGSNPGGINAVSMTTGFPAGIPIYMQEIVWDSQNYASFQAAKDGMGYFGEGVLFQATPSAAAYAPVYSAATANSTLQPGTFVPTDLASLGGYNGGIAVYAIVPEPGTFALAGLGLAALLVLRRRS